MAPRVEHDAVVSDPLRTRPARRHDLDRLRILAVLLLFPFHAARVFDVFDPWYVKNGVGSEFLSWTVIAFLNPWHMPLLFVLAGAATWFAFARRSGREYVRERARRLLVPFVFGCLVIVPPQPFLAQLRFPGAERSYLGFLSGYFTDASGDLSGYDGGLTPAHLWFILYLFLISLAALPLLRRLHTIVTRPNGRDIGRPWMLAALPALLVLCEGLPSPEAAWNLFTCFALFVAGFVLLSSECLQEVVRRRWPWLLLAAVGTMAIVYTVQITDAAEGWAEASVQDVAFQLVESGNTWLWVLGLIGAAGRFLARPETRTLRYLNEAAYPVYILHQTVIVGVAYVVVRWGLGLGLAYTAILTASLAITMALYDVLVRRADAARFLFGLKPRRRPPVAAVPQPRPVR
jgi:glucan biosynthesis protein C